MHSAKAVSLSSTLSFVKNFLSAGLIAGVVVTAPTAVGQLIDLPLDRAEARGAPASFADLVDQVSPAVVYIATSATVDAGNGIPNFPEGTPFDDLFRDFFGQRGEQGDGDQRKRKVQGLGSGFIISPDGLIVTNNHVIEEADEIHIKLPNGDEMDAELVGRDPKTDLAVLRVKSDKPLPYVSWGDSDKARVGDWVIAIGNPLGLGGSVTAGIVSARNRDINSGPYDDFIQTDAPINRGNSGGPLFDMDGNVIGINTAIYSTNGSGSIGIGFAIPAKVGKQVVAQLLQYGETRRGWLGVRIQEVTDDLAEGFGLDKARGALVAGLSEGGPAEDAGIEEGDVILSFDGQEVEEMRSLPKIVADTPIGKTVKVVVWRDGKKKTLKVKIEQLDESLADAGDAGNTDDGSVDNNKTTDLFGLTLAPLTAELAERLELDADMTGVVVTAVARNSVGAEKGVRRGHIIVEVSGTAVASPQDILDRIDGLKKRNKKVALFMIRTPRGDSQFVPFRLDEDEND